MKNYKHEFLEELKSYLEVDEEEFSGRLWAEAATVMIDFMHSRYSRELKQYNKDYERSNDEFIARKNLEYLNLFIEELYLLDRGKDTRHIDDILTIRKNMRRILHNLWAIANVPVMH